MKILYNFFTLFQGLRRFIVLVKYLKPFYILVYSNKQRIRLIHLKMKVELGLDAVGLKLSEGEQLDRIFFDKSKLQHQN